MGNLWGATVVWSIVSGKSSIECLVQSALNSFLCCCFSNVVSRASSAVSVNCPSKYCCMGSGSLFLMVNDTKRVKIRLE